MNKNASLLLWMSIVTASAALTVGGIGAASGESGRDPGRNPGSDDDARASLLKTDQEMSLISHDREAFAEYLAPDVWLLGPDVPRLQGREAFLAASEPLIEMDLAVSPDVAVVSDAGDFGITIGTFHITVEGPDGEPMRRVGKYQTTWRRRDDGRWWMVADMFNFDSPMPGPGS